MRCPTLEQLPPPPPGRTGWPWTEETQPLPDGRAWPRVSIVTPTYNQARFLEGTLRSVLLQGYPDLEYVVINDGSTDETATIIERYAPFLTHHETQTNRGQSGTINKGLALSSGQVFNWLNSDDQLAPGALAEVARLWRQTGSSILIGACSQVGPDGREIRHWPPQFPRRLADFASGRHYAVAQPSAFLDGALTRQVGGVREDLECVMDWELYLRLLLETRERISVAATSRTLSQALYHPDCKTARLGHVFRREVIEVLSANRRRFRLADRVGIERGLARLNAQHLLHQCSADGPACFRTLLKGALRSPGVFGTRFFWGALRRSLRPGAGVAEA